MDDPNGVGCLGVGDENNDGAELPKGGVPALTVVVAVILVGQHIPLEDGWKIHEIDAVLVQVGSAFVLVPLKFLGHIVTPFCNYAYAASRGRVQSDYKADIATMIEINLYGIFMFPAYDL